jgi:hypothetical protein
MGRVATRAASSLTSPRRGDRPVEVHAGVVAHVVQDLHEVLGAHVAGRAGRKRAAAEAAVRRLVMRSPGLKA